MSELFKIRASRSAERLNALRTELVYSVDEVVTTYKGPEVCIYASGSLARHEVSDHSDLDAFFVLSGCKNEVPLGRIADVKILSAIVDAARNNEFPDFSNDGEYLQFLHIDDMIDDIGGREDDYHNALTARMLLILESKWLYNEGKFDQFRFDVVGRYFTDFHKHADEFRPIFLLNDILRFWRTMCLNYENGRHWRNTDDTRERAKGHLANLKLRFSRLNTCFSFIALLLHHGNGVFPKKVIEIADMTPLERISNFVEVPDVSNFAKEALEEYEWFLGALDAPKDQVLDWIANRENRVEAFAHSDKFIGSMYSLIKTVAESKNYLRYLVI